MVLESNTCKYSYFVTLTYKDDCLPPVISNPLLKTLSKKDYIYFLKTLRKKLKFRYYGVGEYGSLSERPHYHFIIFTDSMELLEFTWIVRKVWKYGFSFVVESTTNSIAYVAGYVSKKLVSYKKDYQGRIKEFSTMSRRPGLGYFYCPALANHISFTYGSLDIVETIMIGDRKMPLPKYLRDKARLLKYDSDHIEALKIDKVRSMREDFIKALNIDAPFSYQTKQKTFFPYSEIASSLVDAKNRGRLASYTSKTKLLEILHKQKSRI